MTHKNSVGRKHDDFKTLNYTSLVVQKLRFWCQKKALRVSLPTTKEPTHLEFCGESYDKISEQGSDLPRIRESAFSGYVVAVWLRFLDLFKLLNVVR